MKLVKCLNEKAKTGRIYVLTEQGKSIKEELIKNNITSANLM